MIEIPPGCPAAEIPVHNEPELTYQQSDPVAALWPFVGLSIMEKGWYAEDIGQRIAMHNTVCRYLLMHERERAAFRKGRLGYSQVLAQAKRDMTKGIIRN
jgi:hypothetical protein